MSTVNWRTCDHNWSSYESVREDTFNVAFGSKRTCNICGAVEFENWCETRASGGTPKIYPPNVVQ